MRKKVCSFLFCVLLAGPVLAEFAIKDYDQMKNQATFQAFIAGVGNGLGWANSELAVNRHEERLFCQPPNLVLQMDNFLQILDDEVKKLRSVAPPDMGLGLILLKGLQETFPCKQPWVK